MCEHVAQTHYMKVEHLTVKSASHHYDGGTHTHVCVCLHSCSCEVEFVQERGVVRLWEVARFDFLLSRN